MARKQDRQKVAAAPAVRRWRLKDRAPNHYVQGQGIKSGGEEFTWPTKISDWCVEVGGEEPARQDPVVEQEQDEGAVSAAPDSEPAVEANDQPADAGTF